MTHASGENWKIYNANALDVYARWETPNIIISDGAYGVGGFPGDPRTPDGLGEWYAPHIEQWSKYSSLATTLWFWNTEVGWANVHPILVANGWKYEFSNTWNKGVGQVAGNVNAKTIRRFPVVTEVCVYYTREPIVPETASGVGNIHMKTWLRDEWKRTGMPQRKANEACGVKDAATRKYFDQGWLWYWPPVETMMKLVDYANEHGAPEGRPYYSLNGVAPVTADEWSATRSPWNHEHGVTNVWDRPSLRGKERFKGSMKRSAPRTYKPTVLSASHLNQKPLDLTRRMISASSNEGDVLWEPFGGLCTGAFAAADMNRRAFASEIDPHFFELASERMETLRSQLF